MTDDLKPIKDDDEGNLRPQKKYIKDGEQEDMALYALIEHLEQFNEHYKRKLSMVLPKRSKLKSEVIGTASDHNHLLYQGLLDAILVKCARPITVNGIVQVLISEGEKKSTSILCAPAYYERITQILDPRSKLHRGTAKALMEFGFP